MKSILDEAQEIVHGDRNRDYGHPLDNHACTGQMMTAYMDRKYGTDEAHLDAEDVCIFNTLQKVSRLSSVSSPTASYFCQ